MDSYRMAWGMVMAGGGRSEHSPAQVLGSLNTQSLRKRKNTQPGRESAPETHC